MATPPNTTTQPTIDFYWTVAAILGIWIMANAIMVGIVFAVAVDRFMNNTIATSGAEAASIENITLRQGTMQT